MRAKSPDIDRLVEIARLYYESHLTQERIAHLLELSRPGVQRMIRDAHALGIVKITIIDPHETAEGVGRRLQAAFGLERVLVVPAVRGDAEATKVRVGEAGTRCLDEVLERGATLAVAWGTTVRDVARALRPRRVERLRVVQMVGELGLAIDVLVIDEALANSVIAKSGEGKQVARLGKDQSAHMRRGAAGMSVGSRRPANPMRPSAQERSLRRGE